MLDCHADLLPPFTRPCSSASTSNCLRTAMSMQVALAPAGKPERAAIDTHVLARVSLTYLALTPTERKVADALLADPVAFTRMPMARIEKMAGASSPSIMRFCRAIGYKGLADLKLALAESLAASEARSVGRGGALQVLDYSEQRIELLRQLLGSAELRQAALTLSKASRIGCFASHELGMAATYARDVLLRHGLAATIAATGFNCSPQFATDDNLSEGSVALCFCHGMPDAVLFDRLQHYRAHGLAVVMLSDVALPAFVPKTVDLVLGSTCPSAGAAALFAHCLATDILLAELAALPPQAQRNSGPVMNTRV